MILEDVHWADPTSLEAFGRAVDRVATLRVLLIVTFRPEFEPPWIGQPHVTALTINRLARREVDAMIDRIAANTPVPLNIPHALLAAVVDKQQAELESALDRLQGAGLMFRQGAPPHATYLFKHALVQDAAYRMLLREPRRALHARIAETLESQSADIAERQPELLARHCTEAGLMVKAVGHWLKAGQQAVVRSATTEAVAQLRKGLDVLVALSDGPWRLQQELDLQIALRTALG